MDHQIEQPTEAPAVQIIYVTKPRKITKKLGRPKKNTPEMVKERNHAYYLKYYAEHKDMYNRNRKKKTPAGDATGA